MPSLSFIAIYEMPQEYWTVVSINPYKVIPNNMGLYQIIFISHVYKILFPVSLDGMKESYFNIRFII